MASEDELHEELRKLARQLDEQSEPGEVDVSADTSPPRPPRRLVLAGAVVVLAVLAAGVAVVLARNDDEGDLGVTAGDVTTTTTSGGDSVEEILAARGLQWCETVPDIEAPADQYRDEPVYVGNEMPTESVQAWAAGKPGYEGLWIDRAHRGWIVVAFSQEVAQRRAELRTEFSDAGVVAVAVDWTAQDLEATQDRVTATLESLQLDSWGAGTRLDKGVIDVGLGVLTPEVLDAIEPFAGDPVCFTGLPESQAVPDGPQPDGGDTWRLLADEKTGLSYRTGIATEARQYQRLWDDIGLHGEPPSVDFDQYVVIWFGAVYGSGCEIRLDDVVVDEAEALVHGEIVIPSDPVGCNDDANPRAYVVAIERSALPSGPFTIQLDAEDPPSGVPEERTVVDADLRSPGAVAPDDAIGPDQELIDRSEQGEPVSSGATIESGYATRYEFDASCGIGTLGELNGIVWTTPPAAVPPEWAVGGADAEHLVVSVILDEVTKTIDASKNDLTITYRPAPNDTPPEPCGP